jgi:hypothetical protein
MSTIADLQVKIGADGSGLSKELDKSQQSISKAFNTHPIDTFSNSIEGVTGKLSNMVGGFTQIAALAAGGFGLTSMIDKAVQAGDAVYQLTSKYQMSTTEAVQMNRVLSLTGGSVDTAARAIMRLDKSFTGNSDESKKAQVTLAAYGVSLTDASGKILPLNQQLANLASGYKEAQKDGEGQAFIMNTLGVRGMELTKTLQNYNEAAETAAQVKGIGLNPQEMHQASQDMKQMKMQLGQLEIAAGAALAPMGTELLPEIMPYLRDSAEWIAKNKTAISQTVIEVAKLLAVYEAMKMARAGVNAVQTITGAVGNAWQSTAPKMEAPSLNKSQEQQINRSVRASEKAYDKMRRDAIKTAQQQNMSAEETAAFLSQKFTEIGIRSTEEANTIRTSMTEAFAQINAAAEESAVAVAVSMEGTTSAATSSATQKVAANIEKTASNDTVIASNAAVSESETLTGAAAEEAAGIKKVSDVEKIASNEAVIASNQAVGASAVVAGESTVTANIAAQGGISKTEAATEKLGAAHDVSGAKAIASGTKTASIMSRIPSMIEHVSTALLAMAGGWMGVAAAALYAAYCAYQYFHAKDKEIENETYVLDDGSKYIQRNGYFYKQSEDKNQAMIDDPTGSGVGASDSDLPETDQDKISQLNGKWFDNHKSDKDYVAQLNMDAAEQKAKEAEDRLSQAYSDAGLDDNGNKIKPEKASKDKTDKSNAADFVNFLVQQGYDRNFSLGYAGGLMLESGGNTEDINPQAVNPNSGAYGISQWLDREPLLQQFATNNYSSPSDLGTQEAFAVWELQNTERDNYQRVMSDAQASGDFSPANFAKLIDKYITRSEGTQDIRDQKAANAESLATNMGSQVDEKSIASKILEHQKQVDQAKKSLADLEASLQQNILSDTGTAYETGIGKVAVSVRKFQEEIDKLKKVDSTIDTGRAQVLLGQYKASEIEKVTQAWRERWSKLKVDLAKTNAEIYGDYKDLANAEYDTTIFAIDKERAARLKEVEQSKGDVQAAVAVNEWATAQYLAAAKKRDDAMRDSYNQQLQWAVNNNDANAVVDLVQNDPRRQETATWEAQKKALQEYVTLAKRSDLSLLSVTETAAESIAGGLDNIFSGLGTNITSVSKLVQSFGNLVISTLMKIVAQAAASRLTSSIFGSNLTSGATGNILSGLVTSWEGSSGSNNFSQESILDKAGISLPTFAFADGGVITAPTLSLIGEGKDAEGVFPLNNSTYSNLANHISQNMKTGKGTAPVININNNSDAQVSVESVKTNEDTGEQIYNFTVENILSNKNGDLTRLKQAMGAMR